MITCAQLAEALKGVNVAELARHTGIAEKTIYRLRHQANDPTLGTVEKLLAGIEKISAARQAA
jgi:DNA-binding phage protein